MIVDLGVRRPNWSAKASVFVLSLATLRLASDASARRVRASMRARWGRRAAIEASSVGISTLVGCRSSRLRSASTKSSDPLRMLGKTALETAYDERKAGIGGDSSSVSASATLSPARPSVRAVRSDWRELASKIVQSRRAVERVDPRAL
jgi:hypothetical protein